MAAFECGYPQVTCLPTDLIIFGLVGVDIWQSPTPKIHGFLRWDGEVRLSDRLVDGEGDGWHGQLPCGLNNQPTNQAANHMEAEF